MIEMLLTGFGMLAVTLLIQFLMSRKKRSVSFWVGSGVVFAVSIIGIISKDPTYFAAILGYVAGDEIGELAGWHKNNNNRK